MNDELRIEDVEEALAAYQTLLAENVELQEAVRILTEERDEAALRAACFAADLVAIKYPLGEIT